MPIKAVIFDMDGVLLDSMPYHVRAWQDTFKPLGVYISPHEVYSREGENWRKSTRDFLKMGGYRTTSGLVEKVFKIRAEIFEEIFRPKVFKGAKGLLAFLKNRGLMLGIVTATPRRDVKKMLTPPLLRLFDALVCGDDLKRGKPFPDPYKRVLRDLNIRPEDALVVENAPHGLTSARLAGIKCLAIATSLEPKYLKGADMIFVSLEGLKEYFRKIF